MGKEPPKQLYETTGFSMWPFVRAEDKVIVEPTEAKSLRSGDIILYVRSGLNVCHRLVSKKACGSGYTLFCRGDYAPTWRTEKVASGCLIGRVCALIRGRRIKNLTHPLAVLQGKLMVAAMPLGVMAFEALRNIAGKR